MSYVELTKLSPERIGEARVPGMAASSERSMVSSIMRVACVFKISNLLVQVDVSSE